MGCYDTLRFACPACGGQVEEQTKAGKCDLKTYDLATAPIQILGGVQEDGDAGRVACPHCGRLLTLMIQRIATPVVRPEAAEDEED